MFERIHNLSTSRGPGRGIQPGQTARILSGPRANTNVRVVAVEAPDIVEVQDVAENRSKAVQIMEK